MSTLALTASGDLLIPAIGKGATALVTDPDLCAAMKIADGLRMILGEWIFDTRQGFPWRQIWGQKKPNLVAIRQLLRKAILQLGAPTVISVTDAAVFFSKTRQLQYTFAAKTNSGAIITGGSGQPFIVKSANGLSKVARAA